MTDLGPVRVSGARRITEGEPLDLTQGWRARAEAAEAALERVRALADDFEAAGMVSVYDSATEVGQMIRRALDGAP